MYLNCHSQYSLKYGTISPEQLLEQAAALEIKSLALTDINNTSACLNFIRIAPRYNIKPIIGVDFRNGVSPKYIGLAKNNEGYKELNHWLSDHIHQGKKFSDRAPSFNNALVIYPLESYSGWNLADHEYVGVRPRHLNQLATGRIRLPEDRMVILQTVSFANKRQFNAHRLLRAIDNNTLLSKLPKTEEGMPDQMMMEPSRLETLFGRFPALIKRTQDLLDQCFIGFDFGDDCSPKNQKTYTGSVQKDQELISHLCNTGLHYRYPKSTQAITDRIKKELEVITEKGYISYFLINWDIIRYASGRGYFHVGRGSGANSIVAYLLRITDVDPIELDLYFERFINLYRKNPPDFDLDFSWRDREDVTRYIFKRFKHTALLATYNTFQFKAVVRELGKVFGLPKHEIDKLSASKGGIIKGLDQMSQLVLKYGSLIQGFPSHLSVHAGGILISEEPMHTYTGTFLPPKGFPTTQFDMIVAEDIGLYKFDILGQRGLGKIKEGLQIVQYNRPKEPHIDIHDIKRFKEDEAVKELLRNGKAIGCFYVESPAMRMLLKKLKVDNYLGLVAASSIIRPGVAKSGMMREYILRFRDPERRKDAHPVMLDIMPETFGVMVYQEDVIKVAHYFAGLSLGEADVLRRGMSGKYRSRAEFTKVEDKFFNNCRAKGYGEEITSEVWRQIESFAGYAFSKGHSASYAVESYQSLFLKAHYPLEYMVAVVNNFGGFYRTEFYFHEARMWGATIKAPCINRSHYQTCIIDKDIYIGFIHLNSLESNAAGEILAERERGGKYKNMDDLLDRVSISMEQLSILIRINAFRSCDAPKRELLWKAHLRLGKKEPIVRSPLFRPPVKNYDLPKLQATDLENAYDELELLGFPLCSPFSLMVEQPKNGLTASKLKEHLSKSVCVYGYLVTAKRTRTIKGDMMFFGTFLDQEGHFFDTTHFPQVAAQFPFRGKGVYQIIGKVVDEFGFYSLEVQNMIMMSWVSDPRYSETSREPQDSTLRNPQDQVFGWSKKPLD